MVARYRLVDDELIELGVTVWIMVGCIFAKRRPNHTAASREGMAVGRGMTRTEIRSRIFSNHTITTQAFDDALRPLRMSKLVNVVIHDTGGRPEVLVTTRLDPTTETHSEPVEPQPTADGDNGEAAA